MNAHANDPALMAADERTLNLLQVGEVLAFIAGHAYSSLGEEAVLERRARVLDEAAFEEEWRPVREAWYLFGEREELPLSGLFDPTALLDHLAIAGAMLPATDFLRLARFADLAGPARGFASTRAERIPWIAATLQGLTPLPELGREVRRLIDDDGLVRDTASSRLASLRSELRKWGDRIQKEVQRLLRHHGSAGHLSDSFVTTRDGRYCLPVQASRRRSVPGIVHGASASGETVFVEPLEVVELTNELAGLRMAEEEEIRRILQELADKLRPLEPSLRANVEVFRILDDLAARARAGWKYGLALPRLLRQSVINWQGTEGAEGLAVPAPRQPRRHRHSRSQAPAPPAPVSPHANGPLHLMAAHHPLLKLGLAETSGSVPVAMTLRAGDRVLVLSGPNAGGKTTTLKMVGLLSWLAQAGFPVPVGPDSTLPIIGHIGAAIGDEQDILAGDSTFSAHLKRLRDQLLEAAPDSLILLDEIAAGTDPTEGAPLAIAYLEALAERGAMVICTSHLGPVKEWANAYPAARNASFHLDSSTHAPTFTLSLDIPGTSEALVVAERVGMDRRVVERARAIIPEERRRALELLSTLQAKTREADARAAKLRDLEQKLDNQRRDLEQKLAAYRAERQTYRERLLQEKLRDLRDIRSEIERQVSLLPPRDGLRESRRIVDNALKQADDDARRMRRDAESESAATSPGGMPAAERLEPGMRFHAPALNTEVEVLTIERDRGLVRLLVRGVELEMGLGQLGTPMLPSGLAESELPSFRLDRVLAPPPPAPPAPKPAPAPAKPLSAAKAEPPTPVPLIPLVPARPSAPATALVAESSPAGAQPAPTRRVIGTLPPALEAALAGMLTRQAPVRSPADTMQQQTAPGATPSAPPEMGGPPAPSPQPGKRQGKRQGKRRQQWSDDDFLKSSIPTPVTSRRAAPGFNQPTATTVAASGADLKKPGKADAEDDEAPIVTYGLKRAQAAAPEITLDLHGMRVEEALVAVDRHIDDALMNDYPYVRLMHGFGTGALRRSIREHLRHHPAIRRLTGAPPSEGGGGVTIVEFH